MTELCLLPFSGAALSPQSCGGAAEPSSVLPLCPCAGFICMALSSLRAAAAAAQLEHSPSTLQPRSISPAACSGVSSAPRQRRTRMSLSFVPVLCPCREGGWCEAGSRARLSHPSLRSAQGALLCPSHSLSCFSSCLSLQRQTPAPEQQPAHGGAAIPCSALPGYQQIPKENREKHRVEGTKGTPEIL